MKALLVLPAVMSISLGVCACADTSTRTGSTAQTAVLASTAKDSNDLDDDSGSDDDRPVLEYGHAATPAEERMIIALVKRYYAAATAANGRKACPMIYSIVAEAFSEEYGRSSDPPASHGKSCAVVMSKLFKQNHRLLTAELATLTVSDVRIDGDKALVVMSFATTSEPRKIPLHREDGVWKVQEPLDSGMP